ncbi:MAG: hypothetical protein OFPI_19560 [Osedax symbiont Rs2]|nr:MAG: hypothetical protein OFPI_19560 [Osedax symbiont Rs2]
MLQFYLFKPLFSTQLSILSTIISKSLLQAFGFSLFKSIH